MRWEASVWVLHPAQDGRELRSAWSAESEDEAQEAAVRYIEQYAGAGWEITPHEAPNGYRTVRATKGGETLVIQVEKREV